MNNKRVDVGFAREKVKGTGNCKPSERQVMEFRMERKTCLIQLMEKVVEKVLEKCPASYSLFRHLSCLNPVKMTSNKKDCSAKLKKVLKLLVNAERVEEEECDTLLQQFFIFLDSIPVFGSERFANFQSAGITITWNFQSHGQATVERGFSVKIEIEAETSRNIL